MLAINVSIPNLKIARLVGFSLLIFVRGHFQEISIAALPLRVKPRHVEKFRKCRLTDVRECELRKGTEASKFTKMGTCGG